ncbi:MAG: hypothetical protein HY078_03745 [Elusimicrobia bacterium]|nr:hypothetical protein [Elusimicrobiota bacterium]
MANYDSFLSTDRDRLSRELEWAQQQLKSSLLQLEGFQKEREALAREAEIARSERDAATAALAKGRADLEDSLAETAGLRKALHEHPNAAAEALPDDDLPVDFAPLEEPIFEPGWSRALESLRKTLASSYLQMRRLSGSPLQDGQRAALRLAAGGIVQAQEVVRVIGEYIDQGPGDMIQGNLAAAVSASLAAWDGALRKRGIKVIRRVDGETARIRYAPEPLRVAFYQIIRNAYEALPRGGSLGVTSWREIGTGQVSLAFSDSGPGFSQDALEKRFIPFSSSKPGHLGLGLAVVQRVVQRLGGTVSAQNSPQGSAVVILRFPLEAEVQARPAAP